MKRLLFYIICLAGLSYGNASEIIFRASTSEEAFSYASSCIQMLDWYKENGYRIALPAHEAFLPFYEHPDQFPSELNEQLKQTFDREVYDSTVFDRCIQVYSQYHGSISDAIDKLSHLSYFDLKSRYEIVFTLYGPGGEYYSNPTTGFVLILTKPQKRDSVAIIGPPQKAEAIPSISRPFYQTPIHEIVHIGIEDSLVKKFHLSHWEKERLVDLICERYLKVTGYQMQKIKNDSLDKLVDEFAITNDLPSAIAQYCLLNKAAQ